MNSRSNPNPAKDLSGDVRASSQVAPRRVLLIEDYEPLAEATAEFIRFEGLEVRVASSGRDGLEVAAAFQPDIVLCDLMLWDMSGLEVASALRALPGLTNAVIAMHSAMNENEIRALAGDSDSTVNLCLAKPLTKEKLDALVSQLEILRPARAATIK